MRSGRFYKGWGGARKRFVAGRVTAKSCCQTEQGSVGRAWASLALAQRKPPYATNCSIVIRSSNACSGSNSNVSSRARSTSTHTVAISRTSR